MSGIIADFTGRYAAKVKAANTTNALWDEANEMRLALIAKAAGGADISMDEVCACADAWRAFEAAYNKEGA